MDKISWGDFSDSDEEDSAGEPAKLLSDEEEAGEPVTFTFDEEEEVAAPAAASKSKPPVTRRSLSDFMSNPNQWDRKRPNIRKKRSTWREL